MTAEATPETPETQDEEAAKGRIHQWIADFVKEKTGKPIGITGGKKIFDKVIADIFTSAVKDGQLRFPGGYGSLHVRHLGVGTKPKRLPSGATTDSILKEGRVKLRYQEGVMVKKLLGTDRKTEGTAGTAAAAPTESVKPGNV
jgi:hypothetical protein